MDLTQAYPGVGDKRCDAKATSATHLLALARQAHRGADGLGAGHDKADAQRADRHAVLLRRPRDAGERKTDVAAEHLERLRAGLPAAVPMLTVPELFTKASGRRVVTLMADRLAAYGDALVGDRR